MTRPKYLLPAGDLKVPIEINAIELLAHSLSRTNILSNSSLPLESSTNIRKKIMAYK